MENEFVMWVSKPIYESLPYFYLTIGALCLGASMYVNHWHWPTICFVVGLVCLVAPFLLAYLPRRVIGQWVESGWECSTRIGIWTLKNGKKLAVFLWHHSSRVANTLWKIVSEKLDEIRK